MKKCALSFMLALLLGGTCFLPTANAGPLSNLEKRPVKIPVNKQVQRTLPPVQTHKTSSNSQNGIKSQQMKAALDKMVAGFDGDYSVYVYGFKDGTTYVHNEKPMLSASMIKMFILGKAYEEISRGKLSEQENITLKSSDFVGGAGNIQGMAVGTRLTVGYLLRQMIIESDNVATNIMIDRLGMANINAYITANGYKNTKLQRHMMDFAAQKQGLRNYTSAADLGKIFQLLYKHKCVNGPMDDKMLAILKDQTDNDKIPQGLPAGTVVAHKTGELVGVFNDGGIIYSPKGDYVLVVLGNDVGQEAIGNIADISAKVYQLI